MRYLLTTSVRGGWWLDFLDPVPALGSLAKLCECLGPLSIELSPAHSLTMVSMVRKLRARPSAD